MTNKLKPTSKVIQIIKDGINSDRRATLTVLCEDGSIWSLEDNHRAEWECVLDNKYFKGYFR